MKSTFYEVPVPLAVFAPDGTIEDANTTWDAIFTDDISNRTRSFARLLGDEAYQRELENTRAAFASGETTVNELVLDTGADGPHYEVTRQLLLTDAHSAPRIMAVFYDVSGHIWSYDELRHRLNRVEAAHRRTRRECLGLVRDVRADLTHFVESLLPETESASLRAHFGSDAAHWADSIETRLHQLHLILGSDEAENNVNPSKEN